MKLVQNNPIYFDFIRSLRLHPENISGFLDQSVFSKESHLAYMKQSGHRYFICLDTNKNPVGYIGDVDSDIRLAVDPENKGKGIGRFMLEEFIRLNPFSSTVFFSKVLLGNIPSQRLFEGVNFKKVKTGNSLIYYEYHPFQ
jgi:ribosomal protein S18 acetylase RimI-like enzyme